MKNTKTPETAEKPIKKNGLSLVLPILTAYKTNVKEPKTKG